MPPPLFPGATWAMPLAVAVVRPPCSVIFHLPFSDSCGVFIGLLFPPDDLSAQDLHFYRLRAGRLLGCPQDTPQFWGRNVAQLHAAKHGRQVRSRVANGRLLVAQRAAKPAKHRIKFFSLVACWSFRWSLFSVR
jgi:hypothetical protein